MWFQNLIRRRKEPQHLRTGRWGEKIAADHLKRNGCKMLESRLRVGRRDEIDLVALDGETLLFVEVKTRASERMGRPIDSVKRDKRTALGRAAMRYMKRLKKKPAYFRFDVIEVIGREGEGQPEVRHIANVFTLPRGFRVPW